MRFSGALCELSDAPFLFLAQGDAPAGGGDPAPAAPPGGGGGGGFLGPEFIIMIGLMFLVIYIFMIRPESRRQRTREAMLKSLKKGDTVITTAGIIGKLQRVEEKEVVLQVDKDSNVKIRLLRSAVNEILTKDQEKVDRSSSKDEAAKAARKS